jgi:hypothetical protein
VKELREVAVLDDPDARGVGSVAQISLVAAYVTSKIAK